MYDNVTDDELEAMRAIAYEAAYDIDGNMIAGAHEHYVSLWAETLNRRARDANAQPGDWFAAAVADDYNWVHKNLNS